jgi:hypothetical protein
MNLNTAKRFAALNAASLVGVQQTRETQMQTRALELEAPMRNLELSRRRGEWGMARIALEQCLRVVEGEGSELPIEWWIWRERRSKVRFFFLSSPPLSPSLFFALLMVVDFDC